MRKLQEQPFRIWLGCIGSICKDLHILFCHLVALIELTIAKAILGMAVRAIDKAILNMAAVVNLNKVIASELDSDSLASKDIAHHQVATDFDSVLWFSLELFDSPY